MESGVRRQTGKCVFHTIAEAQLVAQDRLIAIKDRLSHHIAQLRVLAARPNRSFGSNKYSPRMEHRPGRRELQSSSREKFLRIYSKRDSLGRNGNAVQGHADPAD